MRVVVAFAGYVVALVSLAWMGSSVLVGGVAHPVAATLLPAGLGLLLVAAVLTARDEVRAEAAERRRLEHQERAVRAAYRPERARTVIATPAARGARTAGRVGGSR